MDFIVHARSAPVEGTESDIFNFYEVFFGINTTRCCFGVTAIDDDTPEVPIEGVLFRIVRIASAIQVTPFTSEVMIGILDDDCKSVHSARDKLKLFYVVKYL